MILNLIKKIPIDFGQGSMRYTTKGKMIALKLLPISAGNKTALDVGCRSGHFTKLLKKRKYCTTSIDIEKNYNECKIIDANNPLPFSNNYFDVIWCSEVIEHLDIPEKTLGEFTRVLKQDGRAIITTPNSQFWIFRILEIFGLNVRKLQNSGHKHFFGIKDILSLNPHKNIVYGFFPYFILKFRIKKMINLLSPTFIFIIKK